MKKEYIDYLTLNYGRIDKTLEEMAQELGLTPKTIAAYSQRLGLKRNTIFDTEPDEYFKSLEDIQFSKYKISNYGKIINEDGVLITSSPHHQSGYLQTRLINDEGVRKSVLIHVLVANSFLEKPDYQVQVDHKDGNRTNCAAVNLQYLTASENVEKSKKRIKTERYLTKEEVIDICKKLEQGLSISKICETNNFYTKSKVEKIKQRVRWVEISKDYNF